ncbi:MAG: competence/damage-inducible protein A [Crocinitomicaceae bacterium]
MNVEIISIGDELLIGQTINTNASWIGSELALRGAKVSHCAVIEDKKEAITNALVSALKRADVVILTGGLGPTKDDITKYTLAEYFKTELVINEDVLSHVRSFFERRGREMLDVNIQQAALPKSAKVLKNNVGTASGILFEIDGKTVISLPGVPYEMKHILTTSGFDFLVAKYKVSNLFHRTIHFQGIGESYLAEAIYDIEIRLEEHGIKLAYLPSPGLVRLRFTSTPLNEQIALINSVIIEIQELLPQHVFGEGEITLNKVIGGILLEQKATLGTVESCTGGQIAKEIAQIAGSSEYFNGSIISYSNDLKINLVGVNAESIKKNGAVSEQVVTEMATNGRKLLNVDYCIATSGVAGPTGGSTEKPVGTIWICVAGPDTIHAKKFNFGDDRVRNIRITGLTGLNMLRQMLLKINK